VQDRVTLDPKKREALFRDFAEYQRLTGPEKAVLNLDSNKRQALFREFAQYRKRRHVIIAYHDTADDH